MSNWGKIVAVTAAALAVSMALVGCGDVLPRSAASGPQASEDRPVAGVTGVDLAAAGTVEIVTGAAPALTIQAPADILPSLTSDVAGGVLTLGVRDGVSVRNADGIRYTLTVPALDRIVISGSGTVRHPDLTGESVTVEIDGSGDVDLRGSVDRQVVRVAGSGSYRAPDLTSRAAEVTIDGSGEADVRASDTLTISVAGSGDVTYHGSPRVQKQITGSGEVTQVP